MADASSPSMTSRCLHCRREGKACIPAYTHTHTHTRTHARAHSHQEEIRRRRSVCSLHLARERAGSDTYERERREKSAREQE
eukprot:6178800-Pleurochrysis_carterae.AAC.1